MIDLVEDLQQSFVSQQYSSIATTIEQGTVPQKHESNYLKDSHTLPRKPSTVTYAKNIQPCFVFE